MSLPGIGNYTASNFSTAFNKPYIPLDKHRRVLKRYLYLKKKIYSKKSLAKKSIFGISSRSSDYAQALMN